MLTVLAAAAFAVRTQVFFYFQIPWWFVPLNYFFFFVLTEPPDTLAVKLEKNGADIDGYRPIIVKKVPFDEDKLHIGRVYNMQHFIGKRPPSMVELRDILRDEGWDKKIEERNRERHMLVAGTIGSGKTSTLFYHIAQDLQRSNLAVIVVDPKGDVKFMHRVKQEAQKLGRRFYLFSPQLAETEEVITWNPLRSCVRPVELSERIFATLEFDEGAKFYADRAKVVLKNYSELLMGLGIPKRLDILFAAIFNIDNYYNEVINKKYKELEDTQSRKGIKMDANLYLVKRTIESERDKPYFYEVLQNLRSQLGFVATEREISPWVNVNTPDLVMGSAIKEKAVVFFSLPGPSLPNTANAIGRLLVSEIKQTIGWAIKRGEKLDTVLYLDEFPVLVFDGIEGLFSMGRSGGIRIVSAFQNISQLDQRIGEQQTRAILGNINLRLLMKQNDEKSMKQFSDLIGRDFFVSQTEQLNKDDDSNLDGMRRFSASEQEHYIVPPHYFRQVRQGEGFILLEDGVYFTQIPYLKEEVAN